MSELRYIGSKISLVSKSDIRYVGILHSIDPTNATLSLEQVVSYGTEGRRGDMSLPPSDTVFSLIVFRGSDIKDLQVFEAPTHTKNSYHHPPPPQPMMISGQYGYYYYPPLPSSSSHIQAPAPTPYFHNNSEYPQQPPYPTPGPTITPTVFNYPSYNYNEQLHTTDGPQMPIPTIHKPEMPPTPTTQVPHTANTEDVQETIPMKHARKPDLKDEENGELSSKTAYNNRRESCEEMASSIEQLAKSVSELGIGKEQRRSLSKEKQPSRSSSSRTRRKKKTPVPCHDFDFASSNAKFDKQELRHPLEEEDTQRVVPQFYDKSKSFFDDISCEAKEQADRKGANYRKNHWHEKQLNMETFGEPSAYREGARGRGRGMHRGRGNGRKQLRSIA
ncbi:predicted protein [Lichtheimia corymbifera JMRC:FSU:9682]|uniref:Uncharacterized protein n=1 Tax=Lichtheimia corymbifera JMRC:FSU:9682 TaxID=1263082 RepID=A0A068SA68_9FUNG|nr:predicted protein [Lichtheimia corymbifera JMRC:FSU:9682]